MTAIIVVQCHDGIVLCADCQETQLYGELATKQFVSKIHAIGHNNQNVPNCLLACAGIPEYTDIFKTMIDEAISNREANSYSEALDTARRKFTKYMNSEMRDMGYSPKEDYSSYAAAVFVGYEPRDQKTHVYVLQPPLPPKLLSQDTYRDAIGTGGLFAQLLFNVAEAITSKMNITWRNLSTTLVAQFCYIVLGRIVNYDGYSGLGTTFYRMDDAGRYEDLDNSQIFPGHGTQEKYRLAIFVKTLMMEKAIPKDKAIEIAKRYKMFEAMQLFFASEK